MRNVLVILTILSAVFLWDFSTPAQGGDGATQLTEAETVAVLDAPNDFAKLAKKLGFNRVEAVKLYQLNYVAYRVFVPQGSSRQEVAQSLVTAFPDAIID
jgi:hypothetical protein